MAVCPPTWQREVLPGSVSPDGSVSPYQSGGVLFQKMQRASAECVAPHPDDHLCYGRMGVLYIAQ